MPGHCSRSPCICILGSEWVDMTVRTLPICNSLQLLLSGPAFAKIQLLADMTLIVIMTLQDELQSMQARAQYAESRAAVAEAELQALRKVCSAGLIWSILQ